MDWTPTYLSNQASTSYACDYRATHFYEPQCLTKNEQGTQTESYLLDSYPESDSLQDCYSDSEIEAEDHKVDVLTRIVPLENLKGEDEDQECYIDESRLKENKFLSLATTPGDTKVKCEYTANRVSQPPDIVCACPQMSRCPYMDPSFYFMYNALYDGGDAETTICRDRNAPRTKDAEVQVNFAETPVMCMTCGKLIENINSCQKIVSSAAAHNFKHSKRNYTGPLYLDSTARYNGISYGTTPFPCNICNRTFSSTRGLSIHRGRMHKQDKWHKS